MGGRVKTENKDILLSSPFRETAIGMALMTKFMVKTLRQDF